MAEKPLAIAIQNDPQPTNKVSAASNAAGGIAAVVASAMAAYGGPAVVEALGPWADTHPAGTTFVVVVLTGLGAFFATKYGGQGAAYNVLDKPNVPLAPAAPAAPAP